MSDRFEDTIKRLRKGDALRVERIADLAANMRELQARLEAVHERGAHVVDSEGRTSNTADVAGMLFEASAALKKGPPIDIAKANIAKSDGRPPKQRETPAEDAKRNWFDLRLKSDQEAVAASPGWSKSVMYYHFGASGRARGGARVKKSKQD